jgi:putative addiction module component (TIGR02574 family)
MAQPAIRIDAMSRDERLDLLERLWDSLSDAPSAVPVTETHRRELDRHLDALDDDARLGADLGIPSDEVQRQVRARR